MRIVEGLIRHTCMSETDDAKLDDAHYHASQCRQFRNRVGGPRGVNKDGPRVSGVLIPAEPASKSRRARHNSSFARLAGITVTYLPPPTLYHAYAAVWHYITQTSPRESAPTSSDKPNIPRHQLHPRSTGRERSRRTKWRRRK